MKKKKYTGPAPAIPVAKKRARKKTKAIKAVNQLTGEIEIKTKLPKPKLSQP